MKIKLDHNLSRHLQAALEVFGHDVDTAFDEGLARATDKEVLRKAGEQNRILFTLDTDFLNLKSYPPRDHAGIVVSSDKTRCTCNHEDRRGLCSQC